MGRAPCCEKVGLKKGPWTPEEDQKLVDYVNLHGHGSWRSLPKKAGLLRCGKSCRLRWTNYLRPGIKRGKFSLSEEQLIIQLHALLGNRWSAIASHLPKRTDNEIKNYWNTHLKKRLVKMGVDPATHKPFGGFGALAAKPVSSIVDVPSGSLSHDEQWENVRLEAEARLAAHASFLDTTDTLNWQKSLQGQAAAMLWPNKLPNILDITASNSDISGNSSVQSSCSNILPSKLLPKTTQHQHQHLKPPSQESTVTSMNTTSFFENTIGSDDSYTINSDYNLLAGTSSFDIGEEEFIRSFMEDDASDEWTSLLGQLTESQSQIQSQSQSQGQEDLLF